MSGRLLVGIDVGTTNCKAVGLSLSGRLLGVGRARTPWAQVPGGAEVHPAALLDAVATAAAAALDAGPPAAVAAVGVTSMAETGVLLDAGGWPVAPAIAWHDRRGEEEAARLAGDLGPAGFARQTGLKVGPKPALVKYRWLRRHLPAASRGQRWLSVAEWVVHALGGEQVAEPSLASRTGWLDLDDGWWDQALDWSGASADLLPPLRPAGTPAGRARRPARLAGAVLTVAGHDHQCAAVGAGAVGDGVLLDSCGTAEALVRGVPGTVVPEERLRAVGLGLSVARHVAAGRLAVMGGFPSGARLRRVADLLGDDDALDVLAMATDLPEPLPSLADLDRLTTLSVAASADARARAWRGAVEAVARHAEALRGRIEAVAGPSRRVVVVGGWARRPALLAAKQASSGPLDLPGVDEAAACGAALLAGVAAGVYGDVDGLPAVRPATPLAAAGETARTRG